MKISVVIPNFNGKKLLSNNLPTLVERFKGCQIIIVDDFSEDDSISFIKKTYPSIKLIIHDNNMGFASTVNDGLKNADNELVMILNSDVIPNEGIMHRLASHFNDPKVFAIGCLEKSVEGKTIVERGRGIGKFDRGFMMHARGRTNKEDTLWASGGAAMYRKSLWIKMGGLNTLYNPFYWEDIDLSYKALKSGYKIVFDPESIVYHYHDKGAIKSNYSSLEIKAIAYKNQITFVWLNISDMKYLLEHFIYIPFHFIKSVIIKDFAFLKGFLMAFRNLNMILKERRKRKIKWVKTDSEILFTLRD